MTASGATPSGSCTAAALWVPRKVVGLLLTVAFGPEDPRPTPRTQPRTPTPEPEGTNR